jgi:hypothetical protein
VPPMPNAARDLRAPLEIISPGPNPAPVPNLEMSFFDLPTNRQWPEALPLPHWPKGAGSDVHEFGKVNKLVSVKQAEPLI